jgi:hypothetical protein
MTKKIIGKTSEIHRQKLRRTDFSTKWAGSFHFSTFEKTSSSHHHNNHLLRARICSIECLKEYHPSRYSKTCHVMEEIDPYTKKAHLKIRIKSKQIPWNKIKYKNCSQKTHCKSEWWVKTPAKDVDPKRDSFKIPREQSQAPKLTPGLLL